MPWGTVAPAVAAGHVWSRATSMAPSAGGFCRAASALGHPGIVIGKARRHEKYMGYYERGIEGSSGNLDSLMFLK